MGVCVAAKQAKNAIWSAGKVRNSVRNAYEHFKRHGKEFGAENALDYVRKAKDFLRNPPAGSLRKVRQNGDVLVYDRASNTFAVMDKAGNPRPCLSPRTDSTTGNDNEISMSLLRVSDVRRSTGWGL